MTFSFHPQKLGTSFAPLGNVVLAALLLVLPFAPAAHGITKSECTGTTLGGSPVAWDGPDIGGKCVLLDMLLIKVAAGTTVDAAETELEKRTGWTALSKFALFNTIIGKTSQTLDLAGIKAEQSHFSSQSWAAIVELDAVVSAADLVPPVTEAPVGRTDEGVRVDLLPNFPDESSVLDQDYTQFAPIDAWTLPAAVGGDGGLTYALSPDLPAGLTFDETTRTISGAPTVALGATAYTFTATDEDGDAVNLAFRIAVDGIPSFADGSSVIDQDYTQFAQIDAWTLPIAVGGDGGLTYALSPDLPAGLTFDETTRTISGAPTVALGATAYTFTATDADGDAVNLAFRIAVDGIPSFADGSSVIDQDYTQFAPIDAWTLPAAVGGDGGLTYGLSPDLPAGLTFDGTTRTISGTPTVALGTTAYTFTATDADGDAANLAFNITIGVPLPAAHTLSKVGGDEQQGAGGHPLGERLVVSVLDQSGNPYPGAVVTFAVTAGQGSLSVTRDTTDAEGLAAAVLTLGREPGVYSVEVTAAGLDPVTFTATAKATPDFNGDGATNFADFFLFADAFGGSDSRFDLNDNGSVDIADFFLFADQFGEPARAKLVTMAREMIGLPGGVQLQQNAPNPFNSGTVISWVLPGPGPARLEVFSLTGQRLAVLHEGPGEAGLQRLRWDGRDDHGRPLASGTYLYRLVTAETVQTRKLTLLR